ncbi:MAG: hypothetical protein ACK56I_20315, partial [bacterium]
MAGGGPEPGLHAGGQIGRPGAEEGHPGLGGELPEHVGLRPGRAAVVEQDRAAHEQPREEEGPQHPAGGREPEASVGGAEVDVP